MQTFLRGLLSASLRFLLKPVFSGWVPIGFQRAWLRMMSASSLPPHNTTHQVIDMNGVSAERVVADETASRVVLYLHGGGYCVGSAATHRPLAAHIARASGAVSYVLNYRLAPEYPHPAAMHDTLAAYRWLLAQGIAPARIVIAGDSAGGGLALATAISLRDSGLPLPAALVLISPWTDLSLSGETIKSLAWRDPILSHSITSLWARLYAGELPLTHPLCSPLFSPLERLPPMLIQVGSEEILLSDSQRLAERAKAAGVEVQSRVYDKMWHDFQVQAGVLRDSDAAIAEIGAFVKQAVPG